MIKVSSYQLKILLVGDGGVGKTSTVKRFTKGFFQGEYKMTVGVDIMTRDVQLESGGIAALSIWDIAGQERFNFVRTGFYKGASGVLVVFDLTRRGTFDPGVSKWIDEIREFAGDVPLIILGNKKDLEESREVAVQEALDLAKHFGAEYLETSAKTGQNVDQAFYSLAIKIVSRRKADYRSGYVAPKMIQKEKSEQKFTLTNEIKNLINEKTESILTSNPLPEEGFRFLVMGNEEEQKPFVCGLVHAESIVWPPADLNILYNTIQYRLKIGTKDYNFRIYLLSNLAKLEENRNLFLEACKKAQGLVIFYNEKNQDEFNQTIKTCQELRKILPDLEIIVTTGKNATSSQFKALEKLEEEYDITYYDDIDTILPNLLINTLKRQKKIDRKKQFILDEIQKMQQQIQLQNINPESIVTQIKEFIQTMERNEPPISSQVDREIESGQKNLVFISYATIDGDTFQIPKIAQRLVTNHNIRALYWEKDSGINVIKYMNRNIGKCKAFVLFCSENAINSSSVEAEWTAAFELMQNKNLSIIPVFQDSKYIPPLLLPLVRVHYDPSNLDKFEADLVAEIKKALTK